jgi:endonuclease YncB( thermonuclease family)
MMLAPLTLILAVLPAREPVTIKTVVNTNTVVVATQDDPALWVTLLGVGTPETLDAHKPDFLVGKLDPKWLAFWLAPGARALMERRGESSSGRPLVLLYRLEDGYCWNAHLVKVGAAFAAEQIQFPEFGKLVSMEADAQHEGKGLWKGYSSRAPTKPVREPYEVLGATSRTQQAQGFDPSHFPLHAKKRYASQAAARAEFSMMLGSAIGQYVAAAPGQLNHVNAGSVLLNRGGIGSPANGSWNGYTQHVSGYTRKDGTYVQSYYRRPPGTANDN